MRDTMVGPARREPPGPWPTLYERIDMAQRTCTIEGCDRKHSARGWCRPHYDRWKLYGDPLAGAMFRGSVPFCTLDGCERPYRCSGLCKMHYERFRWQPRGRSAIERFWANVEPGAGCWLWTGSLSRHGYGQFHTANQKHQAHRWLYEYLSGKLPESLHVDHLCHNADPDCAGSSACLHRRCVNPSHLEPVTNAENSRRGRSRERQAQRA